MNKIWRPFTQEKVSEKSINASYGDGSYIFDSNGKKYLDLISSWWVNLHGHGNKEIALAIYEQARKLEHVIFTRFSHDPSEDLCDKLSSVLSPKLCKFFFSDNGSTAVEVALKMSYQYWINNGDKNKSKFVSFYGGYHGDTVGAMSVGSGYHEKFSALCFDGFKIPWPSTWIGDQDVEEKEKNAINKYKQCLCKNAGNIAAIILEPMIQGAGGMQVVRSEFLRQLFDLSRENKILIICDEVMTGFFRTGKMFAYEYIALSGNNEEYVPDIICLSKGITGGFLPLAVTIASKEIFDSFLDDSVSKAFIHGHSYTANPVGCAAAVKSFDILYKDECQKNIKNIADVHLSWSKALSQNNYIKQVRTLGTICAFNVNISQEKIKNITFNMFERGFLIRPLGNVVYLLPPYSTLPQDLNDAYNNIVELIDFSVS